MSDGYTVDNDTQGHPREDDRSNPIYFRQQGRMNDRSGREESVFRGRYQSVIEDNQDPRIRSSRATISGASFTSQRGFSSDMIRSQFKA